MNERPRPADGPIYPWDRWADGRPRILRAGADYYCKPNSFIAYARSQAKRRQTSASVRAIAPGMLRLQLGEAPWQPTLAIDFDGVIHAYRKGWLDGSIYDDPVPGTRAALADLSQHYRLVVLTARHDLAAVWAWLYQQALCDFIWDVTNRKVGAVAYIDDRGVRFTSWQAANEQLRDIEMAMRLSAAQEDRA